MPDDKSAKRYPLGCFSKLRAASSIRTSIAENRFRIHEDEYWFEAAAMQEIIPWFQRCWLAAGGKKFPQRARLAEHDAIKRLDLVTGKWTKDG